jgi:hypothetical protein
VAVCIRDASNVIVRGFEIHDVRTASPDHDAIGILVRAPASRIALIGNSIHDVGVAWSCVSCIDAKHVQGAGIKVAGRTLDDGAPGALSVEFIHVAENTLSFLDLS